MRANYNCLWLEQWDSDLHMTRKELAEGIPRRMPVMNRS